ncbi:hypothetical protein BM1_02147 [Bipolaris maydis]|nr:hypothetical protein BM1_02147 [Bipolaris maydis]
MCSGKVVPKPEIMQTLPIPRLKLYCSCAKDRRSPLWFLECPKRVNDPRSPSLSTDVHSAGIKPGRGALTTPSLHRRLEFGYQEIFIMTTVVSR